MPRFADLPAVENLAADDKLLLAQASSGQEKLVAFDLLSSRARETVVGVSPNLQASQYTSTAITGSGAGPSEQDVLTGSVRGNVIIPANSFVNGTTFRWCISCNITWGPFFFIPFDIKVAVQTPTPPNLSFADPAYPWLTGGISTGFYLPALHPQKSLFIAQGSMVCTSEGVNGTCVAQGNYYLDGVAATSLPWHPVRLDTTTPRKILALGFTFGQLADVITTTNCLFELI